VDRRGSRWSEEREDSTCTLLQEGMARGVKRRREEDSQEGEETRYISWVTSDRGLGRSNTNDDGDVLMAREGN
jgi:hypothetical protein